MDSWSYSAASEEGRRTHDLHVPRRTLHAVEVVPAHRRARHDRRICDTSAVTAGRGAGRSRRVAGAGLVAFGAVVGITVSAARHHAWTADGDRGLGAGPPRPPHSRAHAAASEVGVCAPALR